MGREAMTTCTPTPRPGWQLTADGAQQHLLVEGQGPLAALGHVVPHSLIDGEPSQGVGHLGEQGAQRVQEVQLIPTPHHGPRGREGPSQGPTVSKRASGGLGA